MDQMQNQEPLSRHPIPGFFSVQKSLLLHTNAGTHPAQICVNDVTLIHNCVIRTRDKGMYFAA